MVIVLWCFGSGAALLAPLPNTPAVVAGDSNTAAFEPLAPCRLLDTRISGPIPAGVTTSVDVTGRCGIIDTASNVAITVTSTRPDAAGYLSVMPGPVSSQAAPATSVLNFAPGETRAASTIAEIRAGALAVFTSAQTDVIIDVTGMFEPAATARSGRFVALSSTRLIDTRDSGRPSPGATVRVDVGEDVPATASAVAVNITTTDSRGRSYLSVAPAGLSRSATSVLNVDDVGQTRANSVIVGIDSHAIDVYTAEGDHVIVDIAGYFTGADAPESDEGLYTAAVARRVLDTRQSSQRLHAAGTIELGDLSVPTSVSAIVATVTLAGHDGDGYVRAGPARAAQPVSEALTVNSAGRGRAVANTAIVPVSVFGVGLYASAATDVIVDVVGSFTGQPTRADASQVPANDAPADSCGVGPGTVIDGIRQYRSGAQSIYAVDGVGSRGPIVVIGDSLTYQSGHATAVALRNAGWGPICVDGTNSRTVENGTALIPDGLDAVSRVRGTHPLWSGFAVAWVVALGTNDVGLSRTSSTTAGRFVDDMVDAIGAVESPIRWLDVGTTRSTSYRNFEAIFNRAVTSDPRVAVIRWSDFLDSRWIGSDRVHLTAAGVTARAALVAGSS